MTLVMKNWNEVRGSEHQPIGNSAVFEWHEELNISNHQSKAHWEPNYNWTAEGWYLIARPKSAKPYVAYFFVLLAYYDLYQGQPSSSLWDNENNRN